LHEVTIHMRALEAVIEDIMRKSRFLTILCIS